MAQKKTKQKPWQLWTIYNMESRPVGLAWARTVKGARKRFVEKGGDDSSCYVEPSPLEKGAFVYPQLS